MAIVGTPVACTTPPELDPNCPAEGGCDTQNQVAPQVSTAFGRPLIERIRSVRFQQGTHVKINWYIVDPKGQPVDLTGCGFPCLPSSSSESSNVLISSSASASECLSLRFRLRENLSITEPLRAAQNEFPIELVDAEKGHVTIELNKQATNTAGIYFGEVAVLGVNNEILFTNVFYVIIERGQFGVTQQGGPPTFAEIRLHLRDSSPAENRLLDTLKFDDAEIAMAISRPVDYWNESPPDIGVRFTTQNFPWRYHWLEAIVANLFLIAAEQQRANNLVYSAAGVQVNDQNKEMPYEQAAARRMKEWKDFVTRKAAEINLNMAYGGIGSSYGRLGWSNRH